LATQGSIGGNFFKNKFGGCKKENIQGVWGLDRFDLMKKLVDWRATKDRPMWNLEGITLVLQT
jgi:hypothetical protein